MNSDSIQLGPVTSFDQPVECVSVVGDAGAQEPTLQELERMHIQRICEAADWKIKGLDGAAARLGLNPGTLYARMKKLGVKRP